VSDETLAERDRHKPTPPPKPSALVAGQYVYRDLELTPEMYNQLRGLQKKAKDLRQEVRNLRRMSQAQAHTVRETIRDTFIEIRYGECVEHVRVSYSITWNHVRKCKITFARKQGFQ